MLLILLLVMMISALLLVLLMAEVKIAYAADDFADNVAYFVGLILLLLLMHISGSWFLTVV